MTAPNINSKFFTWISSFNPHNSLMGRYYYDPDFIDEKVKYIRLVRSFRGGSGSVLLGPLLARILLYPLRASPHSWFLITVISDHIPQLLSLIFDHLGLPSARILLSSFSQNPPLAPVFPLSNFPSIDCPLHSPLHPLATNSHLFMLYSELSQFCTRVSFSLSQLSWIKSVFIALTTNQLCFFFNIIHQKLHGKALTHFLLDVYLCY